MEEQYQMKDALCAWVRTGQTCSTEAASDFGMPDYYGDIHRILRVQADAHLDGIYPNATEMEYEGAVVFRILFLTEDERLQCADFTVDFKGSCPYGAELGEERDVRVTVQTEQANCRVLGPRKINLKAKVLCHITEHFRRCVTPKVIGAKTIAEEAALQCDTQTIPVMEYRQLEAKDCAFREEIELDGSLPPIGNLLCCDALLHFTDAHFTEDQVIGKGNVHINLLYEIAGADETQYISLSRSLPISYNMENPGLDTDYSCRAIPSLRVIHGEAQENSYGEKRIVALDLEYDLLFACMRNIAPEVTRDVYSTACACESSYVTLTVPRLCGVYHTNFSVNESKTRAEIGMEESAHNVLMLGAEPKLTQTRYDEERGRMLFEGTAQVMALLTSNHGGALTDVTFQVPLRCEVPGIFTQTPPETTLDCRVIAAGGRLDSTNLYVNLEVALDFDVVSSDKETILDAVTPLTSQPYTDSPATMTLYFPQEGERLWEIAKHYHTTRREIAKVNNLTEEDTVSAGVLLITHGVGNV